MIQKKILDITSSDQRMLTEADSILKMAEDKNKLLHFDCIIKSLGNTGRRRRKFKTGYCKCWRSSRLEI